MALSPGQTAGGEYWPQQGLGWCSPKLELTPFWLGCEKGALGVLLWAKTLVLPSVRKQAAFPRSPFGFRGSV